MCTWVSELQVQGVDTPVMLEGLVRIWGHIYAAQLSKLKSCASDNITHQKYSGHKDSQDGGVSRVAEISYQNHIIYILKIQLFLKE